MKEDSKKTGRVFRSKGRKTMKAYRYLLVASLAFATAFTVPAFGQDHDRDDRGNWHQDRDGDRDRWQNSKPYREGYEAAMRDRQRSQGYRANPFHYKDNDERQAYQQGYYDGYNGRRTNGNWGYNNGNRGYYPNNGGGWGAGNGRYGNTGFQQGYQNGLSYGQHDRSVGKPFRPTDSQVYNDGDRGYSSAYGDKGMYKQQFRQGYQQGYQRGYYGR